MKHPLFLIFAIVIVLTFAGCAGNNGSAAQGVPAGNAPSETQTPASSNPKTGLPSISLNASWPKDSVPEELPEYTDGTVTASGEDDGILYIKIKDTEKSALFTYLNTLRDEGWIVTSGDTEAEAELGLHTVTF